MSCSLPTKDLLSKLRKGQDVLRQSIENLKPPEERVVNTDSMLSKRTLDRRCRDSLTISFDSVSNLPKKRARTRQLTPEYETSSFSGYITQPRRASSTPVRLSKGPYQTQDNLLSATKPAVDQFQKDTLFNEENIPSSLAFPSPKLSRIVVDTSQDFCSSKSPKSRTSSLKEPSTKEKPRKGLTVSFVQTVSDGNAHSAESPGGSRGSKKVITRHATQQNLGSSMLNSLNSSKFGAMERRYAQTRKEGKYPRQFRGDDPRLGYDWIAGLLDTSESYPSERDDEYFEEMKEFRRVNYSECHLAKQVQCPVLSEDKKQTVLDDDAEEESKTTCVSSYMLNDRLFPVHLSTVPHTPGTSCPTCEDRPTKTHHPSNCVRVSVPHSLVQPLVQSKPHRRRSFDSTDSMCLAKHCMAGWETAQPSVVPPQSTLDLKSSLTQKHASTHKNPKQSKSTRGHNLLDTSHTIEYSIQSRASSTHIHSTTGQ